MICNKCGSQIADGSVFCPSCGANLAQPTQNQSYQQPNYQQPYQQNGFQQPGYPGFQQPGYPGFQQPTPATVPGKGVGIASMVLGIISLALFCIWYVSIPCAIIAAILGGVGMYQAKQANMKNGIATAGFSCACIAIGLAIAYVIIAIAFLGEIYNAYSSML